VAVPAARQSFANTRTVFCQLRELVEQALACSAQDLVVMPGSPPSVRQGRSDRRVAVPAARQSFANTRTVFCQLRGLVNKHWHEVPKTWR
jgi:hypothetical protein